MKKGILPKQKMGRIPHIRTEYKGKVYASRAEAGYAHYLEGFKHNKKPALKVVNVETQVAYPIFINNKKVFTYLADFRVTYGDKRVEVIDVKSIHTLKDPMYNLKKKCVAAYYGIKIKEVIPKGR